MTSGKIEQKGSKTEACQNSLFLFYFLLQREIYARQNLHIMLQPRMQLFIIVCFLSKEFVIQRPKKTWESLALELCRNFFNLIHMVAIKSQDVMFNN